MGESAKSRQIAALRPVQALRRRLERHPDALALAGAAAFVVVTGLVAANFVFGGS